MVKNKTLVNLSGLLMISGICFFFFRTFLFIKYAHVGTLKPDSVHTILLNNHCDYAYITLAQSNNLTVLLGLSVSLAILAIIIDIARRKLL